MFGRGPLGRAKGREPHRVRRSLATSLLLCFLTAGALAADAEDAFQKDVLAVFEESCLQCHGGDAANIRGDVDLRGIEQAADLRQRADLLERIIEAVEFQAMPPEDQTPLSQPTHRRLLAHLRQDLRQASATTRAWPRTPIRRMNRFQYNNAVHDLFELQVDVFALPERMLRDHNRYFQPATGKMPDTLRAGSRPLGKSQLIDRRLAGVAPFPQDLRAEHGFDNRGDHLSLSPLLMESFLKLGRSIVESPDFTPATCGIWKTFFASPPAKPEATLVRDRLEPFLTHAFRRPVSKATLERYTAVVMQRLESGASFPDAMKTAAAATLASPRFLYLYDAGSRDAAEPPDAAFDLASRLSFFLWGSLPDPRLLQLAEEQQLNDPEVLAAEVERMLDDRRMKRFCDSFPAQWLQLERIISSVPDREKFPEFYFAKFRVSMHMMLEPLLLFETILIEDRSILELIDSDFSYRSELLESWYRTGQRGRRTPPTVIPFRRVEVADRRQGGIITNAATLTMTSGTQRTKPITRGAWLATVIFHAPPEPPPADVPPLPADSAEVDDNLTLRERLDAHRDHASCASCHAKIDPLGFALENYGPTGIWRDRYANGRDVDSSGTLFGAHRFQTVPQFKDAILQEKDRFVRGFAAHLLAFALGRKVGRADAVALDAIAEQAAADQYRLRPLLQAIVLSDPFRQPAIPVGSDP